MRTKNLTGHQRCLYCEQGLKGPSGLACVGQIMDGAVLVDEFGPCPYCEAGGRAELRHWNGEYWQGRDTSVVTTRPR